jgi:tRNA1(Val) A37 N6-methylase TrmN6
VTPPDTKLTKDAFLGGRVMAWQPRTGFRSGVDAVLLAAACDAAPGDRVLDLGCGAGVAILCLAVRVPGIAAAGLDLQPDYAALARRNAADAGIALEVHEGSVTGLPPALRTAAFDHVMTNPPYFAAAAPRAADAGRGVARGETVALPDWVRAGARRLASGGWLTLIQRAERLPDVLAALGAAGLGSVAVRPLSPRQGRTARLVLVRGRKGGRAAFRLLAPLVLHDGDRHPGDRDHYSGPATAILRDGAALPWSD